MTKSATKKKMSAAAEALLQAQVRFMAEQLSGPALRALIERELDAALEQAEQIRLDQVVTREAVKQTVRVYAVKLELNAGIPELVADIAQRIHGHDIHARTRFSDLVSDRQVEELLDKLLEMKHLREQLLQEVVANPIYSALAADIVYHGIKGYLAQNKLTGAIPGARAAMKLGKSIVDRATPGLQDSIEERLKGYASKNIQSTLNESRRFLEERFDADSVREAVLDLWHRIKRTKVSGLMQSLRADDLEDLFVIGYEYWRGLRETDWYITLIDAGIDGFFDRYGEVSLGELLEEIGIGRELLLADAMRFAPKAIEELNRRGVLEAMLRRNLEGFYRSGEVEKVLKQSGGA